MCQPAPDSHQFCILRGFCFVLRPLSCVVHRTSFFITLVLLVVFFLNHLQMCCWLLNFSFMRILAVLVFTNTDTLWYCPCVHPKWVQWTQVSCVWFGWCWCWGWRGTSLPQLSLFLSATGPGNDSLPWGQGLELVWGKYVWKGHKTTGS